MRHLMLALALLALPACGGFDANLVRTREAVHTLSRHVQPRLAALCLERARRCASTGTTQPADCKPLQECRAWKQDYVEAVQALYSSLAAMNRVYWTLEHAGVVK